ncbi:hypothetical protein OC842_004577 [Tilletia horrida]|uniref:t-SNARE coiled-coil homology domain-containing protein n=1 Tax=Tilletia horrida TaxID=155126 RepID=A0AAN6G924_9BASI|nr:hypothetical protein OC842_004577 [Tilletia horrida]KAK0565113.1 hypothetical protein OC844_001389 [Tilletia horrida]
MSRDPYHDFASDVRTSLQSARALSSAYVSLLSSHASASASASGSSQIQEAHDRLADAIEGLRQDVQDVRESVAIVQRAGAERFGVGAEELAGRVQFVRECEGEIEELEQVAASGPSGSSSSRATGAGARRRGQGAGGGHTSLDMREDLEGEDSAAAFEREQQQQLLAEQDSSLGLLGRTLSTLKDQASHLGQEINEQVELLGALDEEVDQSQSRLKRAMDRMEVLIKLGDDRLGGWCVWILIVVSG